jgi:hypothetical protein
MKWTHNAEVTSVYPSECFVSETVIFQLNLVIVGIHNNYFHIIIFVLI